MLPGTTVSDPDAFGSSLDALSCGAPDNCAIYGEIDGPDAASAIWVAVKRPVPATATAVTLSAARLVYGREQAGRVSVSVAAASGTPSGTVTVTAGGTAVCVVTLTAGRGSCALPATGLAAGTYQVTGNYGINAGFAYSRSGPVQLVVSGQGTSPSSGS